MAGFTLFELLIALGLTAVIGMVLFTCWDMVVRSGQDVRRTVAAREAERIAHVVLDNDMSTLIVHVAEGSTLPPLSRQPIVPPDIFYALTGREKPPEREDELLVSFACGAGISHATLALAAPENGSPGGPVCVEYRLRKSALGGHNLIRRERAYCGLSGDFPWLEIVLLSSLERAGLELILPGGRIVRDWDGQEERPLPQAVRLRFLRVGEMEEEIFEVPVPAGRTEIGWQE